jgi:flagellar hook-associated protein 3 FlgL
LRPRRSRSSNSLLSLANTQDGSGNYIFSGFATQTQPFTLTATGATYNGDQGQPQVQIAAGQTVATATTATRCSTRSRRATARSRSRPTPPIRDRDHWRVTTRDATRRLRAAATTIPSIHGVRRAYNDRNANNGARSHSRHLHDGSGDLLRRRAGDAERRPAAGDSFTVAPSTNQSLFTTVQNLVNALQQRQPDRGGQTQLSNSIAGSIANIDQALNQVSTLQASVGGRLNPSRPSNRSTSQQTQLQTSISSLQGLDYASAITTLDRRTRR